MRILGVNSTVKQDEVGGRLGGRLNPADAAVASVVIVSQPRAFLKPCVEN